MAYPDIERRNVGDYIDNATKRTYYREVSEPVFNGRYGLLGIDSMRQEARRRSV